MASRFCVVPAVYVLFLRDGGESTGGTGATGGTVGTDGAPGRQVLLQLRQGTGYMDHHWAAAAAGHVEQGETVHAAAAREAAEELGVAALEVEPLCAMQRTGATGDPVDERVDYFVRATSWSGEPRIVEADKCADLRWFDLHDLPAPVVPHERQVIEALRDGTLAPVLVHGF